MHDLQARGGDLQRLLAQKCSVIVDSKDVVGRRRRHRDLACAAASHTRPEEPSLASVGGGMVAGAAFGHARVRDVGAVRISLNQM